MTVNMIPTKLSVPPPPPPPPPPQPFEIVLARKISSISGPLLRTFTVLDGDRDGIVTKNDMKIGIQNIFNIDLQDDQIAMMFLRSVYITNLLDKGSSTEDLNGMRFQGFAKYIENTADSHTLSSDSMNGAGGFTSGRNLSIKSTKSLAAKRKELRRVVLNVIQQNARSAGDGGMAATYIFLGMDSLRNNRISREEFRLWLSSKMGLKLSKEELKLVLGEFWKEEEGEGGGLTFQDCVSFVECLGVECIDVQLKDKGRDEVLYQTQHSMHNLSNEKRQGCDNTQQECFTAEPPIEFLCILSESDIEVIRKFRNALHSKQQFQKDLFNELTKSQSHHVTAAELKVGMIGHGIMVSDDQIVRIIEYFGNGGRIEYFHFVKLLMEKI